MAECVPIDLRQEIEQFQAEVGLLKFSNSQNSLQIEAIQKILADVRHEVSCLHGANRGIKFELMQEIDKVREQVNSDIHVVNSRVTDIDKANALQLMNMVPQVDDLQHRIEACAFQVQSICKKQKEQVVSTDIHQEDQPSIKLEFMQEIDQVREQVKSDIHAVNLRVTDIDKVNALKFENIVPQVDDLQHRIEACALQVHSTCEKQSKCANTPFHVLEDCESWFRKFDDLEKRTQLNLSKTTSTICNLQAKLDMNSLLVSQLFQERSKSPESREKKSRTHSEKRGGSSDSGSNLDVISEIGREASPGFKVAQTHSVDSALAISGRQGDGLRSNSIGSRGFSPVREPLNRELSWPQSRVPSRIATPISPLPTTPQFNTVSSPSTLVNTAPPNILRLVSAPTGVYPQADHGPNPSRGASPKRQSAMVNRSRSTSFCEPTVGNSIL